jgi:hypothetical protein
MSKGLQWTLGLSAGLVALALVTAIILPFFLPQAGWNGYGMMNGQGMMNMMGGYGMMAFMGIGMMLWPLLTSGLVVVGVVWVVKSGVTPAALRPPTAGVSCTHCGKPLQEGWKACPYCGEKVA